MLHARLMARTAGHMARPVPQRPAASCRWGRPGTARAAPPGRPRAGPRAASDDTRRAGAPGESGHRPAGAPHPKRPAGTAVAPQGPRVRGPLAGHARRRLRGGCGRCSRMQHGRTVGGHVGGTAGGRLQTAGGGRLLLAGAVRPGVSVGGAQAERRRAGRTRARCRACRFRAHRCADRARTCLRASGLTATGRKCPDRVVREPLGGGQAGPDAGDGAAKADADDRDGRGLPGQQRGERGAPPMA